MANDVRTGTEPSMASLLTGILDDTQRLIKQEVALARHEFKDEVHKTVQAGVSLGVGVGFLVVGGGLLVLMVVHLLHWGFPVLPLWACYGIVGGLLLLAGAGLLFFAKSRAEEIHLVPPQTAETLKENAQWLKNQT